MSEDKLIVTPTDSDGLRIRSGPGVEYREVARVFVGEKLEVIEPYADALAKIGHEGQWIRIYCSKGSGWVAAEYVQQAFVAAAGTAPVVSAAAQPEAPTQPPARPPESRVASAVPVLPVSPPAPPAELILHTHSSDGLRIRSGPGKQYGQIASILPGDRVSAVDPADARAKLGRDGEWIEIRLPDGKIGWAAAQYMEVPPTFVQAPMGHALVGVHGPTDPGKWPWDGPNYDIIRAARVQAVKVLTGEDIDGSVVQRLHENGVRFVMARLFAKFPSRRTPKDFADEVTPSAARLYEAGVRYFEVHNEPNLHHRDAPEGMWVCWQNGREFGNFLLESIQLLRQRLPEALFGWPGVSPGQDISLPDGRPLRYHSERFEKEAEFAMQQCDFICLHTYWGADGSPYTRSLRDIRRYAERFPNKVIFASEFSNSSPQVSKDIKAQEYARFYAEARNLPPNVGGLFSFVLSASAGFPYETWRDSPIPHAVGARPD